jgi:hypothetical protein
MRKYFETFGHTCELPDEGIEDASWRRWLFKWTTIDPTTQLTRQNFNSYSTIVKERKFHLTSHPLAVHPFSRLKFVWEAFMLVTLLCGLIYAPLQYLDYVDKNEETDVGNLLIMKWVKSFCIVDVVTRFFTGYFDERSFAVSFNGDQPTALIKIDKSRP